MMVRFLRDVRVRPAVRRNFRGLLMIYHAYQTQERVLNPMREAAMLAAPGLAAVAPRRADRGGEATAGRGCLL